MSQVTDLNVLYSAATGFLAARLQFTQDAARVEGSLAGANQMSFGYVHYITKYEL